MSTENNQTDIVYYNKSSGLYEIHHDKYNAMINELNKKCKENEKPVRLSADEFLETFYNRPSDQFILEWRTKNLMRKLINKK